MALASLCHVSHHFFTLCHLIFCNHKNLEIWKMPPIRLSPSTIALNPNPERATVYQSVGQLAFGDSNLTTCVLHVSSTYYCIVIACQSQQPVTEIMGRISFDAHESSCPRPLVAMCIHLGAFRNARKSHPTT